MSVIGAGFALAGLVSFAMGLWACGESELPELPSLGKGGAGGSSGSGGAGGASSSSGSAGKGGAVDAGGAGGTGGYVDAGGTGGYVDAGGAGGAAGGTGGSAGGTGGAAGGTGGAGGAGGAGGGGGAPATSNILCTFKAVDATFIDFAMRMTSIAPIALNASGFKGQMRFIATPGTKQADETARQKDAAKTWPDKQFTPDWKAVMPLFAGDLTGQYEVSVVLVSGKYYLTFGSRDVSKQGEVFSGSWVLPMTFYDSLFKKIEPIEPDKSNEAYLALESPKQWEVKYSQGNGTVDHVKKYDLWTDTNKTWKELGVSCVKAK